MKTKKILSIAAIIIAASVLSTCDIFGTIIGTIGIPINAKAYNNNGAKPSGARAVGDILASGDTISPTALTSVYTSLGTPTNITPTKFVVASYFRVLLSDGEIVSLGQGFLDYAQGITINIGDVPAGITVSAIGIEIHLESAAYFPEINEKGHSYVEFPWTGTSLPSPYNTVVNEDPVFTPTLAGGTAKIHFKTIIPKAHGGGETSNIHQFIYGGDTRKLIEGQIQLAEIFPDIPNKYPGLENNFGSTLVIPMNSQTISSSASSVTLNISWNLDGIISQYGNNASPVFILKNGWWNDLYITVSVE